MLEGIVKFNFKSVTHCSFCLFKGDKLMRLPSYSYDKDDLARHLSVAAEGPEEVVEADEYLQPQPSTPHAADNSAKVSIFLEFGIC